MLLSQVLRKVAPSVVAFGSRIALSRDINPPAFPPLVGTGFVVDSRGLVLTNQHVVEALAKIPGHARFVMVFPDPIAQEGQVQFGVVVRSILKVNSISSFESAGPFFGEEKPNFALVQIDVQGVPALTICAESHTIQSGTEVATLGFPMGERPLTPYGKVSQIAPFARRGIVSSVLPCECADPHGFSIDVLSEGGASGSPIFRSHDPSVIGVLHAGFDGAPITYAVPGHLLKAGLEAALEDWQPDLDRVPRLQDLVAAERRSGLKPFEWSSIVRLDEESGKD